jgi:hypothetical protein
MMKLGNNTDEYMAFPLEFAVLASHPGLGPLRLGFILTIVALAFIVRQPVKPTRKREDK